MTEVLTFCEVSFRVNVGSAIQFESIRSISTGTSSLLAKPNYDDDNEFC